MVSTKLIHPTIFLDRKIISMSIYRDEYESSNQCPHDSQSHKVASLSPTGYLLKGCLDQKTKKKHIFPNVWLRNWNWDLVRDLRYVYANHDRDQSQSNSTDYRKTRVDKE